MLDLYRHYGYQAELLEDHLKLNYKRDVEEKEEKKQTKRGDKLLISYELHPDGSVTGYSEEAV